MSGKLLGECFTLDLEDRTYVLVLLAFCNFANDDGLSVFPSLDRVAWMCGLSRKHVQRIVNGEHTRKREKDGLVDMGLLEVVGHASGGRGHATEYRIDLSDWPRKLEYSRSKKMDIQMSDFNTAGEISPSVAQRTKLDIHTKRQTSHSKNGDISTVKSDTQMSSDPSFDPPRSDPSILDPAARLSCFRNSTNALTIASRKAEDLAQERGEEILRQCRERVEQRKRASAG